MISHLSAFNHHHESGWDLAASSRTAVYEKLKEVMLINMYMRTCISAVVITAQAEIP